MKTCDRFATLVERIPFSAQQREGMHEEVGPLTLPKSIALQRTERLVFLVALSLTLFAWLFHSFVALLNGLERPLALIGFATWRALPIRRVFQFFPRLSFPKIFLKERIQAGICLLLIKCAPFEPCIFGEPQVKYNRGYASL